MWTDIIFLNNNLKKKIEGYEESNVIGHNFTEWNTRIHIKVTDVIT